MSEVKHTPGPWGVEVASGYPTSDTPTIAYVADFRIVRKNTRGYDLHGSNEADANLIAAAPDMLRALKEAADLIEQHTIYDAVPLRALIAKAEGRSS